MLTELQMADGECLGKLGSIPETYLLLREPKTPAERNVLDLLRVLGLYALVQPS